MSVATKNPFAILDDDVGLAPEAPQKASPAPPAPPRGTNKPKTGGPAARGGKYYARGGKAPQSKDAPVAGDDSAPAEKKFDSREGGRGRGRGRGRGDSARGRGRQFDRHSATGKTDSDKKIHQSWGGDDGNAELQTEQAATTDAKNDWGVDAGATADWAVPTDTSADWAAPTTDAAPAEGAEKPEGRPRREREPEEEDNTLTLDQYLAQQKDKDAAIPKLEGTRKANEGASEEIWAGAVALSKPEEEEVYFAGKTKSAPKARTKKEEKVYLEIEARFDRPDRGGRGRGGRGGDRGQRGAPRGGRGGRNNGPAAVNVDDQAAFPSLS